MKPHIRVALDANGNIEAATYPWSQHGMRRVLIDPITTNVIEANVKPGTDLFRWLVTAARTAARTR